MQVAGRNSPLCLDQQKQNTDERKTRQREPAGKTADKQFQALLAGHQVKVLPLQNNKRGSKIVDVVMRDQHRHCSGNVQLVHSKYVWIYLSVCVYVCVCFPVFLTQVVLPALQGRLLQGRSCRGDVHVASVVAG